MINLKQIRKERGKTQQELADLLGLKIANVSHIEIGKVKLKIKYVPALCKFLNCTAKELLGEEYDERTDYESSMRAADHYKMNHDYVRHAMMIIDKMHGSHLLTAGQKADFLPEVYNLVHLFYESGDYQKKYEDMKDEFERDLKIREAFIDYIEEEQPLKKKNSS